MGTGIPTAARRTLLRCLWLSHGFISCRHLCRSLPVILLALWLGFTTTQLYAQQADQAFASSTAAIDWNESAEQIPANLAALNSAYLQAKGSNGAQYANFSIRGASASIFELFDQDGRFISQENQRDFSHELEIRLKAKASIDYETLPSSKQITLIVNAVAKTDAQIRRTVHSSEVADALAKRDLLTTPASLTITINVIDFDEAPMVASLYHPDSNFGRGYMARLNDDDRAFRIPLSRIFSDPEKRPLHVKENSEDVEIREFSGRSPNFGLTSKIIGSTYSDNNLVAGNNPETDGRIVTARIADSSLFITPVKDIFDGVRKAEVWVQGWDQRGPTSLLPSTDPAATSSPAKITVLVQHGNNRLPRWVGSATGFAVTVVEGISAPLTPTSGSWSATDPDGDAITYSILNAGRTGACVTGQAGISFAGACIRIRSPQTPIFDLSAAMDYELVADDPVGRFMLLATDSRGAIAEAEISVFLQNVDEPISGGFKSSTLSIHLPTSRTRVVDLSQLFTDPEQQETIRYSATSSNPNIVTVNAEPQPVLTMEGHGVGRATVTVHAISASSAKTSSVTVIVRDQNTAPSFPTAITHYEFQVLESAGVGSRVGLALAANDSDIGDVLTYEISENARFGLTSDGLRVNQIQLVTLKPLDFEFQSLYELVLTASDGVDSTSIPIKVHIADVDEKIRASGIPIPDVRVRSDERVMLDVRSYFIDDANSSPVYTVTDYNRSIAEIFVGENGELTIYGNDPGRTDVILTAVDSAGGVAAKQFTIVVSQPAPEVDDAAIADRSMELGLLEVTLEELLSTATENDIIAEVESSDEDVVWVLQPKGEPDTLVFYAWVLGTAEISLSVREVDGGLQAYSFMLTVTAEIDPEVTPRIANQTLTVGQHHGVLSLLDAFSDGSEEPRLFRVSSADESVVTADLANVDVVAWWQNLDCAAKLVAVGDSGLVSASNPYCQDFTSLRAQHKVVVRAVAAHHVLLFGLAPGSAQVTATAIYESGTSTASVFTTTVQSDAAASTASSKPHQVAYLGEQVAIDLASVLETKRSSPALVPLVHDPRLATVQLNQADHSLDVHGLSVGSTMVALIAKTKSGHNQVARFNLRVVNRAPQATQPHIAITLEVGEGQFNQDLGEIFQDSQPLRFELDLPTTNLLEAYLEDSMLLIVPLRKGSVDLLVSATDPLDASTSLTYSITISEEQLTNVAKAALAGYGRALLNSFDSVIGTRLSESLVIRDAPVVAATMQYADVAAVGEYELNQLEPRFRPGADTHTQWKDVGSNQPRPIAANFGRRPSWNHSFVGSNDKNTRWSIWLNSDTQVFDGDRYQGRVESLYAGADLVFNNLVQIGLAGSQADGSGDFSYGDATRLFNTEQSLVSPYVRYEPCEGTSFWGIGSIGTGSLALHDQSNHEQEESAPIHDLQTTGWMFGAKRQLAVLDSVRVSWTGDLARLDLKAEGTEPSIDTIATQVQRLRSGISLSTTNLVLRPNLHVRPFATLNLRYDGGRDRTGGGIELIGGAAMSMGIVDFELRGRRFETRDEHGYGEHGFAMSTTLNPSKSLVGWSATFSPTWGSVDQRMDFLTTSHARRRNASEWLIREESRQKLGFEGTVQYGTLGSRDRFILTPYVRMRHQSIEDYRMGIRLQSIATATKQFVVDFSIQQSRFTTVNTGEQGAVVTARLQL